MSIQPTSFGPYTLTGLISQGPTGDVYRASSLTGIAADQPIAIKIVHPPFSRDTQLCAAFDEATALARRVSHPHIVPCLETGVRDGSLFAVSELAAGVSLDVLLRQQAEGEEVIPPNLAVSLVLQLCDALTVVHRQGRDGGQLVHGGIKPSNIMVDGRGVARILDLGTSFPVGLAGGLWWMVPEALRYLPPESLHPGRREPQFDVFSLAALLVELLSLTTPVRAAAPVELLRQMQSLDLRPTVEALAQLGIERDLIDLIEWALDPDPQRRVEDASCFLDSLTELAPSLGGEIAPEAFWGQRVTESHSADAKPSAAHETSWDLMIMPGFGQGDGDDTDPLVPPGLAALSLEGGGGVVVLDPDGAGPSVLDAILAATEPKLGAESPDDALPEVTDETPPLTDAVLEAAEPAAELGGEVTPAVTEEEAWSADPLVVMGEDVEDDYRDQVALAIGDGDEALAGEEYDEDEYEEYESFTGAEYESFTGAEYESFTGAEYESFTGDSLTGDEAFSDAEEAFFAGGDGEETADEGDDDEDEDDDEELAVGASVMATELPEQLDPETLGVGEKVDLSAILGDRPRPVEDAGELDGVIEVAVGSIEDDGEVEYEAEDGGDDDYGDDDDEDDGVPPVLAAVGAVVEVGVSAEDDEEAEEEQPALDAAASVDTGQVDAFAVVEAVAEVDGVPDDDWSERSAVHGSPGLSAGVEILAVGDDDAEVAEVIAIAAAEGDDDEVPPEEEGEVSPVVLNSGALQTLQSLDGETAPLGMDDIFAAFGGNSSTDGGIKPSDAGEPETADVGADLGSGAVIDMETILAEVERIREALSDGGRRRRYGPLPDGTIIEGQIKVIRRVELEPARALYEAVPAPEALTRRCWECGYAHNTRDDRRCFRCRRPLVSRKFSVSARWERRTVERELKLMTKHLIHPAISRIYAFLVQDGQICRLMAHRGDQLLSAAEYDLPMEFALKIALSLSLALNHLSANGVLLTELLTSQVKLSEDGAILYDPEIAQIYDEPLSPADQLRMCEHLGRLLVTHVADDVGGLKEILGGAASGRYQSTDELVDALRSLVDYDGSSQSAV